MKKNIVIVALVIFIGLLMLYSFQQKSYADVRILELEMEVSSCKNILEQQRIIAEKMQNWQCKQWKKLKCKELWQ